MDQKAFSMLSKLADSGDAKALFEIGKMYFSGRYINGLYIPQDKVKGYGLIKKAAALGCIQARQDVEWRERKSVQIPTKTTPQIKTKNLAGVTIRDSIKNKAEFRLNVSPIKSVCNRPVCPKCFGTGQVKTYYFIAPCPNCKRKEFTGWRKNQLPPPFYHPWWQWTGRK